jgi:hypothetical protein
MLTKIVCPNCKTEGTFSLSDPFFDGPYKCWKCKALLRLTMDHGVVKNLQPMSAEELKLFEEAQAIKNKFRRPA